jgi:putative ABC transport system permease protein
VNEPLMVAATAITPGYFRAIGVSLLRGDDVAWTRAQIVVSEGAARRLWPGEEALGKRIAFGTRDTLGIEVVGIVPDAHNRGLEVDPPAMIYLGYESATSIARTMTLVVRGSGDAAAIVATTKRVLREVDPLLPLYNVRTVREIVDQSVARPRLNTTLMTLFATVAAVLAILGIYGVVSYSVTQRAHEIGVRMALGAQRRDILRLVLREGAGLAAIGAVLGIIGAFAGTVVIRSWLFGIEEKDPLTMVVTSLGLVLVAMIASYLPARRAARVDPVVAMRGI